MEIYDFSPVGISAALAVHNGLVSAASEPDSVRRCLCADGWRDGASSAVKDLTRYGECEHRAVDMAPRFRAL